MKKEHHRHSRLAKLMLGAHVTYYGATSLGFHMVHSVAAGLVGILIVVLWFVGEGEIE